MLNVLEKTSATAAAAAETPPQVRSCRAEDLAAVAALFKKTFRHRVQAGAPKLEAYLGRVFLDHPWRDPEMPSRVFLDAGGAVRGFIGVFPLRLLLRGEPVSAAVAGSLMVDDPAENPLAGARLMRSFLSGPQDLSLSETANAVSRRMWERLGGTAVPAYSMEFLRIFHPAGFALAVGAERAGVLKLLKPFGRGLDTLAARVGGNPFRLERPPESRERTIDVGEDEAAEIILRLASAYALRPAWDEASLNWFLADAAEKERYGRLRCRVVIGRKDVPVGAYLVYARPRGIAFVLQMLARPEAAEAVVDSLLDFALAEGAVALRGRVQPEFADPLLRRRAVLLHAASTLMQTRRDDIAGAIRGGEALITGLAGESWSRLIGGAFA